MVNIYKKHPKDNSIINSNKCPECKGTKTVKCYNYARNIESCEGTVELLNMTLAEEDAFVAYIEWKVEITCPKCDGTGKI